MAEMTDEFKEYISALAKYLRTETFHGEYRLDFKFKDEPHPDDADSDTVISAEMECETTYLWAVLRVYPDIFEKYTEKKYDRVGRDILHEIVHLFYHPVYQIARNNVSPRERPYVRDINERQVCLLTNTLAELLPDGWYLPENRVRPEAAQ